MRSPQILGLDNGIIGCWSRWLLLRAGARPSVMGAGEAGGAAPGISWAWINASWGNPEPYFRLRVRAMEEWHRLERELPAVHVAWTGSLSWELPAPRLEAFARQHAIWGYEIRRVDRAEARRLEPKLVGPP